MAEKDNKIERQIKFKDPAIKKLSLEKGQLIKEGIELTNQIDALERKRALLGVRIQKLKDKIIPAIAKKIAGQIGETEETVKSDVVGDEIVVDVVDALESFKYHYLQNKKKLAKKGKK